MRDFRIYSLNILKLFIMSEQYVKITSIEKSTHDTLRISCEKPANLKFKPGQATNVAIDTEGWREEARPFTFTSLPDQDYIEFIIKTYPSHEGVTNKLLDLKAGDRLILSDVYGSITYKGEGVFIAGGSGITPFISILRNLHKKGKTGNNKLIFANKTKRDIILKDELENMLGDNFVNILSDEKSSYHSHGFITKDFLKQNIEDYSGFFYICGPPPMMEAVEEHLHSMDVEKNSIIKESF